jgi:hypothetical protein
MLIGFTQGMNHTTVDDKNTVGSWSIKRIFTLRRGWQEGIEGTEGMEGIKGIKGIEENQRGEEVSHHV